MLKISFLSNLIETCKEIMGCCRGTPLENLDSKLLDIVSYINYYFGKGDSSKLLIVTETGLQLWSKQTGKLVGNISFHANNREFEIHYTSVGGSKKTLGSFDPFKPSSKIAPIVVNLLSDI